MHDIIFPMQATSDDLLYEQQNLWIIDERLNYHSFVSSDKRLSTGGLGTKSALRPDLVVFDRKFTLTEGVSRPISNLVVIEFKRPMRDDYSGEDNPLRQVVNVIDDIRSGDAVDDAGRPIKTASPEIPTVAYIICDITPSMKRVLNEWQATETPDKLGYYGYHKNFQMYYEVIEYEKLLLDAERRNRVFFEKLHML